MSYDWLTLERTIAGLAPTPRWCLMTVSGTAANEFQGFPADLARMVGDEECFWKPIVYPAMTFPMDRSCDVGVDNLIAAILGWRGPFALCGYSQGALVVCRVWRDEILNPLGRLHHRLKDCFAVITYGDPMRATGIANGNVYAGMAVPGDGGIASDGGGEIDRNLTAAETPWYFMSFAHEGDIYCNTPQGTAIGDDMTAIFDIVMMSNGVMSFAAILKVVLGVLTSPLKGMIGVVGAIIKGLRFVAGPVPTLPHVNYDVSPAARWVVEQGRKALRGQFVALQTTAELLEPQ